MEQFGKILAMAFVVVSIYDILKGFFYTDKKINFDFIATAVLGILLALAANLDIFSLLKIDFAVPFIGQVLTGLVISKGSNYVFDFISKFLSLMTKSELK